MGCELNPKIGMIFFALLGIGTLELGSIDVLAIECLR
jgi:hypothetical protein